MFNVKAQLTEDLAVIAEVLEGSLTHHDDELNFQIGEELNQIKNELEVRQMDSEFDAVTTEVVVINYRGQMMDMITGEWSPVAFNHTGNPIK